MQVSSELGIMKMLIGKTLLLLKNIELFRENADREHAVYYFFVIGHFRCWQLIDFLAFFFGQKGEFMNELLCFFSILLNWFERCLKALSFFFNLLNDFIILHHSQGNFSGISLYLSVFHVDGTPFRDKKE